LRSGEERRSTGLQRPGQPTLCQECVLLLRQSRNRRCTQIAINKRIFREIIPITKADQMEQDYAKQMEAEAAKKK